MQNLLRFAPTVRASGEFTGSLNQGKVAMIDVDDIAAVAASALTTEAHTAKPIPSQAPKRSPIRT
jgi:uncharacterized protein YbjT (DUF2867 family)